jgi:hypothetical protein
MAIKHGWDGALYIGTGEAVALNSWTINWTADALENTAFGDDDREYTPGLRSAVVDFSGYYTTTSTAVADLTNNFRSTAKNTAQTVVCLVSRTAGSKSGWTGSGPVTALTIGGAVDGLVPFSGSIQISAGLATYST